MANQDVIALKNVLDAEDTTEDRVLEALRSLEKKDITADIIRTTRIGATVGKLRKRFTNTKINSESSVLVERWKKVIQKETSTSSPQERREGDNGKRRADKDDEDRESLKIVVKRAKTDDDEDNKSKSKAKPKPSGGEDGKRAKCIEMLRDSIGADSEYVLDPVDVATEIEQELFKTHGGANAAYTTKLRSLVFNIKKNTDLRQTLMQGGIPPSKLCSMAPADMASGELKELRKKWANYHMEAAKDQGGTATTTDMFKCGKCGRRETTYYQMQTRSADEPMTTFHTCARCGHRWKS
eukprot:TRINITY_DN4644_c0_g1_i1.p1 TRINITY_DN4644_c0_g1~~TRINITY_DN4644_c0_g1_i1.p1  ORF type:complete len:296 (+),score=84.30 TRINITY_DN4644_c0_g1_i1:103-990(+)